MFYSLLKKKLRCSISLLRQFALLAFQLAGRRRHAPPDSQAPLDLSSPPAGPDNQTIPAPSPCRVARALSAASRSNLEARSSPALSMHGGRPLAPARCATHLQASCTLTASRPLPGFPAACLPGPLVVLLSPYTTYVQDRSKGKGKLKFYPWSRDIWLDQ